MSLTLNKEAEPLCKTELRTDKEQIKSKAYGSRTEFLLLIIPLRTVIIYLVK